MGANNAIITIFVGIPENDKKIDVSSNLTPAQVLENAKVSAKGTIQHNGRTLTAAELGKSLADLGFVDKDSLYVVSKMDGAH